MDKQREKLIELIRENPYIMSTVPIWKIGEVADQILADEEIKHAFELLKAEKEGRLLETPCKVGDIVLLLYLFENEWRLEPITVRALRYDNTGLVIIGFDCGTGIWKLREDRIGKDVFLSCEDAEKALAALHQPQTKLAPTESTTESTTAKGGEG